MSSWPRPPRLARFATAAQSYDAVGLALFALLLLACMGAIGQWSRDDFRSPRGDWSLDACERPATAMAKVRSIDRADDGSRAQRDRVRIEYTFVDAAGTEHFGESWMPRGELREGEHRGVEHLPLDPLTSRLRGGKRADIAWWLPWYAGYVALPLMLAFGAWLAHAWRVLVTLRNGVACDAIAVELVVKEPAGVVLRNMQRCFVRFRWRSPDGVEHESTQRPRVGTALARALANAQQGHAMTNALVICSTWSPRQARLVARDEVAEDRA